MENPKTAYSKREKFDKPDECYTPEEALYPLLPFVSNSNIVWDCAYGSGRLAEHLSKFDFIVKGREDLDFLKENVDCDIIITNPPYSLKDKFLERAFELGKPFAFLLPLTTLEGMKRNRMFQEHEIQIIIPNRRINFEIPSGKKSAWFATAWFCYKMNLPKQLNFVELNRTGDNSKNENSNVRNLLGTPTSHNVENRKEGGEPNGNIKRC